MENQTEIRAAKELAREPYAWPGGYPKFALMNDGECLCASCIKDNFALIARSTRDNSRDGWTVVGVEINWEDTEMACANCSKPIESAYGE